ncbi:YdiU domain-containing protein [Apiospora arundinis]|uniref:Pwi domain mrna processing protein n=1 Tax=Apiospora arundinis TaxID=335852 RepID=A0ABR2J5U4_9PEZI
MASSVDMKLLRATKFPPEFNQKVDMQKVNLQVMKKWIASRISEILGSEDDVVTELCFNLVEGSRYPDIKSMQIQLTGFLDKDTAPFCKELWKLFLSAQGSPQGVPKELLEAKKAELIQEKIQAEKAAEEARVRRENQERRDRELSDIRERERRDRGFRGGRGGDNWRGGGNRRGGDRAFEDRNRGFGRGRDRSVTPPRRGSYRGDRDRYVPQDRRGGRRGRSPTRSVSADSRDTASRSRSRSRSLSRSRSGSRRAGARSVTPPRRSQQSRGSPPRRRDTPTQILQFAKPVTISPSRQSPTVTQVSVFIILSFAQSQPSSQARPGAHQPQSLSWQIETLQHSQQKPE